MTMTTLPVILMFFTTFYIVIYNKTLIFCLGFTIKAKLYNISGYFLIQRARKLWKYLQNSIKYLKKDAQIEAVKLCSSLWTADEQIL